MRGRGARSGPCGRDPRAGPARRCRPGAAASGRSCSCLWAGGEGPGAVLRPGQRRPEAVQVVERVAEEALNARAVELAERHGRGEEQVGVAHAVPGHLVPDVLAVARVGIGAELIAQPVVVGHHVAVRAAEPLVGVAAPVREVAQRAVFDREAGLERASVGGHGRFGHHRVALDGPHGHEEQADGGALLAQQPARRADHAAVEVVVLHGVAVFVRHELLDPRHRVAVDGGRREELHTRFGSHITRPLERKFIGCSTNGMRIGPWRKP